jgi:iron complex outermembrane receptor protein
MPDSTDMSIKCFIVLLLISTGLFAQERSQDTIQFIQGIVLKGYETGSGILQSPASISVITNRSLKAASNFSLLPALNQVAGVRMEERSPGSYRLSIRGSLLRSPFGVRNIKVYLDDFILSDAGGNTYMNLLDVQMIGKAEIIKGPAGSIYGAGTGGAVLLASQSILAGKISDSSAFRGMVSGGRFGHFNEALQYEVHRKGFQLSVSQGHMQSSGYRDQSAMRKDNLLIRMKTQESSKMSSEWLVLLADLQYETPGGLNLSQRNANPRQSRPAAGNFPSAKDQRTAIFNQSALIGFTNSFLLGQRWKMVSSLSTGLTGFRNPFISNYEKRREANVGIRTKFVYESSGLRPLQWVSGFEVQRGAYRIDSTGNNKGVPNGNLVRDEVVARQQFIFTQLNWSPFNKIQVQTGLSFNNFAYSIERTTGIPSYGKLPIDFNSQVLPRLAVSFEPLRNTSIYGQLAKGYSSPTVAEIRPSAGGLYQGLQAEYGWNREVGVKWSGFSGKVFVSAAFFHFNLRDAIVRQTNAAGAEFFINAGNTVQKGAESEFSFLLLNRPSSLIIQRLLLTQSITLNDFRFGKYIVAGTEYSGKKITGVPDKMYGFTMQMGFLKSLDLFVNFNYAGMIPLTDANSVFTAPYRLWTARLTHSGKFRRLGYSFFLLADNIGNIKYSLGNDLNAFGGRFYNPSASRNLQLGFSISR